MTIPNLLNCTVITIMNNELKTILVTLLTVKWKPDIRELQKERFVVAHNFGLQSAGSRTGKAWSGIRKLFCLEGPDAKREGRC